MKLFKIAYILFFGGLIFIYLYSQNLHPTKIAVCDITNDNGMGKYLCTFGTIKYFYKKENLCFITIENSSCSIKVVSFNCKSNFHKNQTLYVIGKLAYYKGEKEIIAKEMALFNLCE